MTLLALLAGRAGEIVTRSEIRQALWGDDTFVDFEASVNACVSQIRVALGDSPTAPRFLETIPRKGYRFVAPVAASHAPSEAAAPLRPRRRFAVAVLLLLTLAGLGVGGFAWVRGTAEPVRIAVLPIEVPSGEADLQRLGALLQEGMLVEATSLAGGDVAVIARPAVEHVKGAARTVENVRAARVEFFVDAALQRVEENRIRLHTKVARTADSRILWARDYEFPPAIFIEQRLALAKELAQRLIAATAGGPAAAGSRSTSASDAMLSATIKLRSWNDADVSSAVAQLRDVCDREPGNTRLRGLVAFASVVAARRGLAETGAHWDRARQEASRALRQQPDDPNASTALGAVALFVDRDLEAAGRHLRRAAAHPLAPVEAHAWLSVWLSTTGAHDEAIAEARLVEDLEPISNSSAILARALYLAGRPDEARVAAARVLAIHPQSSSALVWLERATKGSN
jgi:DNA-binding winged helix-turn-helix (wHTH) protein/TolB-like protein